MRKFFDRFAEFTTKNAIWIIIGTIVMTVGLGLFILRLEMNNDLLRQVSPESEIGKLPHYINETFGGVSPLIIVLETDDIFTYENLSLIREITRSIETNAAIENAVSITETKDMSANDYGIMVDNLFNETISSNAGELAAKKKYILGKDMYIGTLISADGKYAMILVTVKGGFRIDDIARKVRTQVEEIAKDSKVKLYFGGTPAILNSIYDVVIGDITLLVPFVIIIVALILFLTFGTLRGISLPLLSVGMATIMAMGIMGVFMFNFSMIGAAIPVVLIAVGNAYGIHMLNKYYEETAKGIVDPKRLVHNTIRDVGLPILMAGMTTFFGFLSLIFSDLAMIKDFGIISSAGVVLALVIAILFIPALLSKMKPQRQRIGAADGKHHKIGKFAEFLSKALIEKKAWVFVVFGGIAIACLSQFGKLYPEMDYLSFFARDSEPVTVSHVINDHFGGYNAFSIYLKGDISDADIEKLMTVLEEKTKSFKRIASIGGVHDMIAELNFLWTGVKTVPETKGEIENLWFFIDGQEQLKSMVTKDKKEAAITFLMPSVSQGYEKKIFTPLNELLDKYRQGIKMAPVNYTNGILVDTVAMMLSNAYMKDSTNAMDIQKLKDTVRGAGVAVLAFKPAYPSETLLKYLLSAECEVTLTKAQAERIISRMKGLAGYSPESVYTAIAGSAPTGNGVTADDVKMLAESLSMRYAENVRLQRYNLAADMVYDSIGIAIDRGRLKYALGPLFWETLPMGSDYTGAVAGEKKLDSLELTGYAYLTSQIKQRLYINQLSSLIFALIAVLILNSFTFRSLAKGIVSITAIIFTLLVNFGVMGLLGIPLDLVSVTIASIAIGTGIDYSIHFTNRFSLELERNGGDEELAVAVTLSTTGVGILANAFAVGLGFVVLMFSSLSPLRTLGGLLAVSMIVSSIASLTLLPAVFHVSRVFRKKITK